MNNEKVLSAIRQMLNRDGIKLWLEPYTQNNQDDGNYSKELLERYSRECNLGVDEVNEILVTLRTNALRKLSSKKKFEETGVASLKIKPTADGLSEFFVEIDLNCLGVDLKCKVAEYCSKEPHHLKLISRGQVIIDDRKLLPQNVKNNGVVMALVLSKSETEAKIQSENISKLETARKDAQLLSGKEEIDENKLQIADQSGKIVNIPAEETQALTVAMTFNAKGSAYLKSKCYSDALLYLLEADREYSQCRSDILSYVDNYALVCLDIVWCYLCLKSISDLPDAEKRLKTCRECFQRSYGTDCERLMGIRGSIDNEAVLFARLHLLEGIVAFHRNRRDESKRILCKVKEEIDHLRVDDDKLAEIVSLGYGLAEARLGLRSCHGNVPLAVSFILERREKKREILKKEKDERQKRSKIHGKTESGEVINVDFVNAMVDMGYSEMSAKRALQKSNNSISSAIQILQENPELLTYGNMMDEAIARVCSVGFDYDSAKSTLESVDTNVDKAIEMLTESSGSVPTASTSAEAKEKEKEAFDRLAQDIPKDEDDHLDVTLDEESQFLNEYLSLFD